MSPLKIIEQIYNYKITLNEAIEKQAELKELINKPNDYGPKIKKVLKSAKKIVWCERSFYWSFWKRNFSI